MSKATGIKNYPPDRLRRSKDAIQREADRNERTPEEQLAILDSRPGKSARERARLTNG
jgi:hypothetical protein